MSKELTKRILSSIVLLPMAFYFLTYGSFISVFFILVCFILACYEWHMMTKDKSYKIYGFIFLIFSFLTFYKLSMNLNWILFVILICIATDVGGYTFGKVFKGPKLTKISPNKTFAGMIGGYFLSLITLIIVTDIINYSAIPIQFFLITILVSTISQIGDIIISYFKRKSNIKNTGNIIPGHGGLLDRIDGMIFAIPTFYLVELTGYLIV